MKYTIPALAAVAALSFGTVAISEAHTPQMSQGYDMLEAALMADFERMGIPTEDLETLTLGQIAAIKQVVESSENEGQQKGQIEAIIANN